MQAATLWTWATFHLATIVALTYYTRRSPPHFDAAVCLLIWYCLRNLGYEHGIYESNNVYQTMAVFMALSVVGFYKHRHSLFVFLVGVGGVVTAFNVWQDHTQALDAYWAKSVLGALYQLCVATVFVACLTSHRTNSPS